MNRLSVYSSDLTLLGEGNGPVLELLYWYFKALDQCNAFKKLV
jgi:hypothetical protein